MAPQIIKLEWKTGKVPAKPTGYNQILITRCEIFKKEHQNVVHSSSGPYINEDGESVDHSDYWHGDVMVDLSSKDSLVQPTNPQFSLVSFLDIDLEWIDGKATQPTDLNQVLIERWKFSGNKKEYYYHVTKSLMIHGYDKSYVWLSGTENFFEPESMPIERSHAIIKFV